jgi:TRAP-type C4-dicarboxylate transport system substrate-binding protein
MRKSIISVFLAVIVVSLCIFAISGPSYAKETFKFRLATHYNTQHPGYKALQNIVKEIDEKTKGAIKIKIYPSSQLGDYTLTYEDLMRGSVDMALIPIPSEFDPKLEMNFIPYLASSYAEMGKAFGPDLFLQELRY